ncbi:hypothetical protein [Burkholderia sp. BCC0405]|uniref:hypothetical protein n=1 Tax=Burkholderia sp. BCC0405 TaxID=2676298 RepID=UPI00158AD6DD|nr:hypothetical protein [Burkholderia sp. BCC0405]
MQFHWFNGLVLFPAFGVARAPCHCSTYRIAFLTVSAWLLALAGSAIVMFARRGALPGLTVKRRITRSGKSAPT